MNLDLTVIPPARSQWVDDLDFVNEPAKEVVGKGRFPRVVVFVVAVVAAVMEGDGAG